MSVEDLLIRDEGMKLVLYQDTGGRWTIGVGRNLEDVGISEDEAIYLLRNDILTARLECAKYKWFPDLPTERKDAIVCMMFNLGAKRFSEFKRLHDALAKKDYNAAASEMLNSQWAAQVKGRAVRLAELVRSGIEAP